MGKEESIDWVRTRHLLKLGLFASLIALTGDMLLGWGRTDSGAAGLDVYFSRYLTVSDGRLFWSALLGVIGISAACLSYFAIYRLVDAKSHEYAHALRAGLLGMMLFGSGVHIACCGTVYFYKKLYAISPETASEVTLDFAFRFLLPITILFTIFFGIFIGMQIASFAKGKTPCPKWTWIFNSLFGVLCAAALKAIGNYPLTNALATGWINLGGIWMCSGLLAVTGRLSQGCMDRRKENAK